MADQQDVVMDEQVAPQADVAMDQGAAPQVEAPAEQQPAAAPAEDVAAQQQEMQGFVADMNRHHQQLAGPEWRAAINNSDRCHNVARLTKEALPKPRPDELYVYRLRDLVLYSKEVEAQCLEGAETFQDYTRRVGEKVRELESSEEKKEEYYELAKQATANRAPVAQAAPVVEAPAVEAAQ